MLIKLIKESSTQDKKITTDITDVLFGDLAEQG